jgi:hypothetical protein
LQESDNSNVDWLSVYVEDCFSSSSSFANPVSVKPAPTMANKSAENLKLLPPSSNARQRKGSPNNVASDDDDQQYVIPLFIEPPLLLIDQKHWMAESELILPKNENNKELCQQQGQEYEEEKCEEGELTQFPRELLLKRYGNCLSCNAPIWRHGPLDFKMLCNACKLKVKPENRFTTILEKQYGLGTNEKQEQGKRRDKKKIKKTANAIERELPLEPTTRMCTHCMSSKTPQWRTGPLGPKTLCNACGVRFKSGRLLPEYRPANSPTFASHIHSNSHKKVLQLRQTDRHY